MTLLAHSDPLEPRTEETSWGAKAHLQEDNCHSIDILTIRDGESSSMHSHKAKWNLLFVLKGCLEVEIEFDPIVVHQGQMILVKPGNLHRFKAVGETQVLEDQFVWMDPNDIIRISPESQAKMDAFQEGRGPLP